MAMAQVVVFTRFERFWHWSQALLIILMMLTGFEIHGSYQLWGFAQAVAIHELAAWVLIGLWAFAIFWHLTTGEWRQYIPTTENLMAVMRYYTLGIYHPGIKHPFKKTRLSKHNPLQRLAYLFFKLFISTLIWISGLLYLFYADWPAQLQGVLRLEWVAAAHFVAALAMLLFFIAHVYMSFTAKPVHKYFMAMVTGKEDLAE
jgi:thiosulfate reductase cytochrome b subunit